MLLVPSPHVPLGPFDNGLPLVVPAEGPHVQLSQCLSFWQRKKALILQSFQFLPRNPPFAKFAASAFLHCSTAAVSSPFSNRIVCATELISDFSCGVPVARGAIAFDIVKRLFHPAQTVE